MTRVAFLSRWQRLGLWFLPWHWTDRGVFVEGTKRWRGTTYIMAILPKRRDADGAPIA